MDTRKDIRWAFIYFIITISLGFILRIAFITGAFFDFRYVTHAHSHTGLLGWVYSILTALIGQYFLEESDRKAYIPILILTQISIWGMLFTFPFGGYFLYSIIFSSLFIISSYWFSFFFLRRCKKNILLKHSLPKLPFSVQFVRWGIFFLIISSLGIWLLPVAIQLTGKNSEWYQSAIYFFLHFQYNGWFLAVLIGLLVGELEKKNTYSNEQLSTAYYCFIIGTLGSVSLSLVGFFGHPLLYIIGNISAFFLLISIYQLYRTYLKSKDNSLLLSIFLFLLSIKTVLMFLGSFPWIAKVFLLNKDFIISYLHFTFLGVIVSGVLHFLEKNMNIHFPDWSISLYFTAFIGTEALITYKGLAIWKYLSMPANYFSLLVFFSSLFLIATATWIYKIFNKNKL